MVGFLCHGELNNQPRPAFREDSRLRAPLTSSTVSPPPPSPPATPDNPPRAHAAMAGPKANPQVTENYDNADVAQG